jgi:hypothetical protein
MRVLALAAVLWVAACASAPPPIDIRVECPPLRTWTKAEQIALAAALSAIPEGSVIWVMQREWQATRDAIRACKKSPN